MKPFPAWLVLVLLVWSSSVSAEGKSSVVYFQPPGESIRPVAFAEKAFREIADARKNSPYPKSGDSVVPSRLHPLVMDFVALLGGTRCKDYRFVELRRAQGKSIGKEGTGGLGPIEIWVIDACGTKNSYHIALFQCNKQSGRTGVAVAPAMRPPRPIFYGAEPLSAGATFACPDM